ncbi:G-protein coupled peptide receptor [Aureococcus anophagefferens]|nr:G-protein coupled peptide receptor [Aureococcus anophagefferens]
MAFERKGALGQTVIMGVIFLLVFIAYYMLQGYASILFGADLASDALVTLYAVFTAGCFFAPGVVNRFGGKRSLAGGVVGYACFSAAAFACAALGEPRWTRALVVGGGALNGAGAAVLWTAQGRILLGGGAAPRRRRTLRGLLVPLQHVGGAGRLRDLRLLLDADVERQRAALPRLHGADRGGRRRACSRATRSAARADGPMIDRAAPGALAELASTMRLFGTKRALCLALLFWYTGYNQPYQLNGFGDRFFRKRVVGLQLASFYFMEVVGGFVAGRALDDKSRSHRRSAVVVLCQFVAVTAVGFGVAGYLGKTEGPDPAKVQTYTCWLIGALYPDDAEDRCRMVGFFKLTQSLGWCVGFAFLPAKRCAYFTQLVLTGACFVAGTALACLELPRDAKLVAADAPLLANEAPGSLQ